MEKQYLVPQNADYFLKKYRKRRKNFKVRAIFFSFLLIIVSLVAILNLSDLFSSLITNSGSLFYTKKIECASYNVYAVSITHYDNEIQANQTAIRVAEQGGAGVVFHNGEYFVLTSCYPTLAYAQEVCDNLKALGHNSKIVCLSVEEILCDYKGKNSQLFLECFKIFQTCYNTLFDLSLELDKKNSDYIEVNSNIVFKLKQIEILKSQLEKLNSENDRFFKDTLIKNLTSFKSILESGIDCVDFGNNYTANLKQVLIKIVVLNQELVEQIKTQK